MSYEINEDMARRAHEMRSDREYVPGSATAEYQRQVDEARRIAEEVKAQCKTTAQRNRVDGMLDKYELTLAFAINRDNEVGTWCPSILIVGGANFPVEKKKRQGEAWSANLMNYNKAAEILDSIRDYGHNAPINSRDPEALTALRKKLERVKGQHEHMKAVNLFYRENDTLDGCPDIGPLEKAAIECGSGMTASRTSHGRLGTSGSRFSKSKSALLKWKPLCRKMPSRLPWRTCPALLTTRIAPPCGCSSSLRESLSLTSGPF